MGRFPGAHAGESPSPSQPTQFSAPTPADPPITAFALRAHPLEGTIIQLAEVLYPWVQNHMLLRPKFLAGLALTMVTVTPIMAETVYVTLEDEHALAAVSLTEGRVLGRYRVGQRPRGIAADAKGQTLWVAVSDDDAIVAVNASNGKVLAKLPSGKDPETFALDPLGHRLYVSNENDNAVTVVDLDRHHLLKTIPVGVEPEGICTSPDGALVASTSETTNMVHWIDTAELKIIDNTPVDPRPRACTFSPDGKTLWVSSEIAGTVSIIDVATRRLESRLSFQIPGVTAEKIQPVGIRIDRQQQRAYVALGPSNRVAIIDVGRRAVLQYLLVGQRVWNLAFNGDESRLITANGLSNDISIIDVAAAKVLKSVAVGRGPWGLVVGP